MNFYLKFKDKGKFITKFALKFAKISKAFKTKKGNPKCIAKT